jgi:hypothetical protein
MNGAGHGASRSLGAIAVAGLLTVHGSVVRPGAADLRSMPAPRRLAVVDGLSGAEAVSYDPAHNAYYVSNVNGSVGVKDGNGFISRITADGRVNSLHFIQGGRNGVELNGPMGSRIRGDTLWVLDIDALRAFDTGTGAPLARVDLTPLHPLLPNDLTFGPEGDIYITDTGLHVNPDGTSEHTGPDRIYWVTRDRRVTVLLEDSLLNAPDGIAWDPRRPGADGSCCRAGQVRWPRDRVRRPCTADLMERLQRLRAPGHAARPADRPAGRPAGRRLPGRPAPPGWSRLPHREPIRALDASQ